jgi:uncharacterized membrane protein HdeD (DUF308 family)
MCSVLSGLIYSEKESHMFEIKNAVYSQLRWHAAVRGILAIIFGILLLVWPGMSLLVLVYLFGAFALVSGFFAVVAAFQLHRDHFLMWSLLLEGLVGIAIGLITFFWPGITSLVLLVLIAIWAIAIGIGEIAAAFSSDASAGERWMTGIAGALSIVFGILLFRQPGAGLLAIVWIIGFYAIIWGIVLISYSMQQHGTVARPL